MCTTHWALYLRQGYHYHWRHLFSLYYFGNKIIRVPFSSSYIFYFLELLIMVYFVHQYVIKSVYQEIKHSHFKFIVVEEILVYSYICHGGFALYWKFYYIDISFSIMYRGPYLKKDTEIFSENELYLMIYLPKNKCCYLLIVLTDWT